MPARKKKSRHPDRRRMAVSLFLFLAAVFALVSLATHTYGDDLYITGQADPQLNPFRVHYANQGGMLGAYLAYFALTLVGWLAFFLPLALAWLGIRLVSHRIASRLEFSSILAFSLCLLVTMTYNIHVLTSPRYRLSDSAAGGFVARQLTQLSVKVVGETGSYIVLGGLILVLVISFTSVSRMFAVRLSLLGFSLPERVRPISSAVRQAATRLLALGRIMDVVRGRGDSPSDEDAAETAFERNLREAQDEASQPAQAVESSRRGSDDSGDVPPEEIGGKSPKTVQAARPLHVKSVAYKYPSTTLLSQAPQSGADVSRDELEFTARMLKDTLETFDVSIDGGIETHPGPIITRYELKPAAGVKVNQIVNLSDDLALALRAKRIRIIAPIPGKAAVGVEVPNRNPKTVYLRDILESASFKNNAVRLPLALGKTTSGRSFVTDLTKMPHMLIAGATGSGKSVCMNVLITSLLFRLHPYQVRFILIDPKMLELSVYSGIPHLARPVVTKSRRAEKVLADTVAEMERRYRKLADASVRNIEDYNKKQARPEDRLPYIVIFVDELADLMMSATSSKTELLITRLAQMSRAVGIHLILATQRPSVDVITGLIKANFPARIAFQVSSKVDSRTIIDANGAEKLLGLGDMLFLASGQPEPQRIHGAYVSSDETETIVKHIKDQGLEMMTLEGISQASGEVTETSVDFGDPLFREACEVVVRHKQGSVSLLQRRLGVGYQRAARLIDKLEQAGVVSAFDGSKAREVLVDKAYIDTLFAAEKAPPAPQEKLN